MLVLRWDREGQIAAAPIQGPEGERALAGLGDRERLESWHLLDGAGRLHSAGDAFAPLLELLPGGRPLAALTSRFPTVTNRAYFWVARHRAGLSRLVPERAKASAERQLDG